MNSTVPSQSFPRVEQRYVDLTAVNELLVMLSEQIMSVKLC